MKKWLKILAILCFLAVIAAVAYQFFYSAETDRVGVLVSEKVKRVTIQTTISSTGTLSPMDTVNIGTQVSGDISKIYVDFNSKVKKGQVLAELDRSKLQAALYQAQIAASSAKIDYEHKISVYERTKKLAANQSASTVDLENAEYEMNSAKLSWQNRESEVRQAKLNLSYCIIKSPIDGVVLERSVDVGQTVAASMSAPTLFLLAKDLSKMRVMAKVDEADIGSVKPGQQVSFSVDAFQEEIFQGVVETVRLNPTVTSNVVTYSVVIVAENPDLKLLPGMTATCTIVTEEVENAISVPASAIKFAPAEGTPMLHPQGNPSHSKEKFAEMPPSSPMAKENLDKGIAEKFSRTKANSGEKHVWINIDGKAALRPVKTGITDGVNVQILKGLDEGDSVIVKQESIEGTLQKSDATSPFMPGPKKRKNK